MQIPLEVCREFGQFAYQDEQKGIEAIAAIQGFMEEYQGDSVAGDEPQARAVTIARDQAGIVTAAKSVKLLPNVMINLKRLIKNTQTSLQEATNLTTIVIGGALTSDWIMKVGAVLYFIYFTLSLKTVKLTPEHAGVLIALHHLSGGELKLEIPLSELQARMQDNYQLSFSTEEQLDDVLEDLVDLRCVSRQQDVIYLTEKVILKDD